MYGIFETNFDTILNRQAMIKINSPIFFQALASIARSSLNTFTVLFIIHAFYLFVNNYIEFSGRGTPRPIYTIQIQFLLHYLS